LCSRLESTESIKEPRVSTRDPRAHKIVSFPLKFEEPSNPAQDTPCSVTSRPTTPEAVGKAAAAVAAGAPSPTNATASASTSQDITRRRSPQGSCTSTSAPCQDRCQAPADERRSRHSLPGRSGDRSSPCTQQVSVRTIRIYASLLLKATRKSQPLARSWQHKHHQDGYSA